MIATAVADDSMSSDVGVPLDTLVWFEYDTVRSLNCKQQDGEAGTRKSI
jgi:hypothetical protein